MLSCFLKACPKCQGDLVVLKDMYGEYVQCLQCGYLKDLVNNKVVISNPDIPMGPSGNKTAHGGRRGREL